MKWGILLLAAALLITDIAVAKDRKHKRKNRKQYQQEEHCNTQAPCTNTPAYSYTPQAMQESNFKDACRTIENAKFDDDRMDLATFIAGKNYLTSDQILAIAKMFSFDDSRLKFAKHAYASCIDQHNYYKLNNALTFSSNKEELMNYISNQ